jgi:hypothetical protein
MSRGARSGPALAAALAALACGCGPAPTADEAPASAPAIDVEDLPTELEALRAIGYVEFADSDESGEGVVLHDAERSAPGVNLYVSIPFGTAFLIDAGGAVLHRWQGDDDSSWTRAELLPDGDLLVISQKGTVGTLLRLDWKGAVRWRFGDTVHHDFAIEPDGSILVLTRDVRRIPEVDRSQDIADNTLVRLSPEGAVLDRLSLYEALRVSPYAYELKSPMDLETRFREYVDWFHCNSVERIGQPELESLDPVYSSDNVVLSSRSQDAVMVVDTVRRSVVWMWGRGELSRQHEASVLPSGMILLFDNGTRRRGWSRILEIDPLQERIAWEWTAPVPTDFFSAGRGTVQRLPNDNRLVSNSGNGEAFEITRDGDVVWRFFNPQRGEQGGRASLRMVRYEAGEVARLLERRRDG